jgi:hypothetical protein
MIKSLGTALLSAVCQREACNSGREAEQNLQKMRGRRSKDHDTSCEQLGGFRQYYFNSYGDFARLASHMLCEIGANNMAQIVDEANAVFGPVGRYRPFAIATTIAR